MGVGLFQLRGLSTAVQIYFSGRRGGEKLLITTMLTPLPTVFMLGTALKQRNAPIETNLATPFCIINELKLP